MFFFLPSMLEKAAKVTTGDAELQILSRAVSVLFWFATVQFDARHGTEISSNDGDEQIQ